MIFSNQLEVSNKEILYPHIFSFSVQNVFPFCYTRHNKIDRFKDYNLVDDALLSIIFFLLTTLFFFCKSFGESCDKILDPLFDYESFNGQKVNMDKLVIFFSNNTPNTVRILLVVQLNISYIDAQDKYLSLSSIINKSKKATFNQRKSTKESYGMETQCYI